MRCIGVSNETIKWFHSTSQTELFFVSLDNVFPEVGTINCGVPQGSILVPLSFFLLYTNDILQALSDSHIHLHAENTSIFFINIRMLWKLKIFFKKESANKCKWFIDNMLSINFGEKKTKYIIFNKEKNLLELNITYEKEE